MLAVKELVKDYPTPSGPLSILKGVTFELRKGDALSIMGPSGGGKSTLLFVLGALDSPTSGSVTLDGVDPFTLDERRLAAYRNAKIGFVFQDHCLLPQCSVLENVLAPTLVARNGETDHRERARTLLAQVGLDHRLDHRPSELSGGEKQRVAIARALVRDPLLLLCDEPTGNLDGKTSDAVAALLLDLDRRDERILVTVTHSDALAARFPKRMRLDDGKLAAS